MSVSVNKTAHLNLLNIAINSCPSLGELVVCLSVIEAFLLIVCLQMRQPHFSVKKNCLPFCNLLFVSLHEKNQCLASAVNLLSSK